LAWSFPGKTKAQFDQPGAVLGLLEFMFSAQNVLFQCTNRSQNINGCSPHGAEGGAPFSKPLFL